MAVVARFPSWDEVAREARPPPVIRRGGTRTVVSLRGEQNMNTAIDLAKALAAASAVGDGDVVVDLSKVQFMDAAIITALVRGRNILRSQSRALVLRAPSGFAGRLLHLCGLIGPIDQLPTDPDHAIPRIVSRPPSARASAPMAGTKTATS
jgi:anti-sigma B factor antagonist